MTGLRLPNSPPQTPTLRSRLPCAMAGARPVPSTSPAPTTPVVKPRRVTPCPLESLVLLIAPSCRVKLLEAPVVFFQSILHDLVQQRDQAGLHLVRRAVDVGNETGIGPVHRPAGDAGMHDPELGGRVMQHLAIPQVSRQGGSDAIGTPVRHGGKH